MKPLKTATPALPDLPCACATARRAARLVTQLYSGQLRHHHLEASQLTMLSFLNTRPGKSQTTLARVLGLDKTTLSRNLKVLQKHGWIKFDATPGQRELGLYLTHRGQELVKASQPDWQRAQDQLRSTMTSAEWDVMWKGLRLLTRAAHQALQAHI